LRVKFLFRWAFRLLLLVLVLSLGLVLLKDMLLKELLQNRFRDATGLEARIGRLEVGILAPTVTIEDLRIFNPPEFGGLPLLVTPEIHLEYDRPLLLRERRLRLTILRLNISELTVVQNASGQNSLEAVFATLKRHAPGGGQTLLSFGGINTLNLTVTDLRRVQLGPTNVVKTWPLGIRNEVMTGLNSEKDVSIAFARLAFRLGLGAPNAATIPQPPVGSAAQPRFTPAPPPPRP
jgi:hypothetical protein